MGKLVILTFNHNLEKTSFSITAEIYDEQGQEIGRTSGYLPTDSELNQKCKDWKSTLNDFIRLKEQMNSKNIFKNQSIYERVDQKCNNYKEKKQNYKNVETTLVELMNCWLQAESFQSILQQLNYKISTTEPVRVIIYTSDSYLSQFPWEKWYWLNYENRKAHLVFATSLKKFPCNLRKKLKIGIVFGNLDNVSDKNIQQEIEALFKQLPDSEIEKPLTLSNTTLNEIGQFLQKEAWDILCFIGHGKTHNNLSRFYINEREYLEIQYIENALRKTISRGIKLIIFGSCDCLEFASEMAQRNLEIPNLIVMRDIIHYQASKKFIENLLNNFVQQRQPLHIAFDESRKSLETLNSQFPGSTLMPVLFQNSREPQLWENWLSKQHNFLKLSQAIVGSLAVTALVMVIRSLGILLPLELQAYDHLMQRRSLIQSEQLDNRILVVEITEEDTNQYGGYPLRSDTLLSQLLKKLEQYKPRVIGIDIHRSNPQGFDRTEFINAFKRNANIFIVCAFGTTDKNFAPPPEFVENLTNQLVFSNLVTDEPDNTIRRQLLSYSRDESSLPSPCTTEYSLSFRLASELLIQENLITEVSKNNEWQIGKIIFQPLPTRFGAYQSLDGSYQIMLNYRLNSPGHKLTLQQVLNGQIEPEFVKNRIVLIGYTASVARDESNTPYRNMSGIWIHAHMTSQIISAVKDRRSLIWVLPQWGILQWGDGLWILVWSTVGGLLTWGLKSRSHLYLGLAMAVAIWLLYFFCLVILAQGGWMPLVPSILSLSLSEIFLFLWEEKANES